jgi:hypothetical protein
MTTAMAAWPHTWAEGPWHHRRTAGPTGAHAGCKGPTGEDERLVGTARTEHPGVVMTLVMPSECGTGEEDDRHHENNPGDDHHPGRSLVEPRRSCYLRRRRRRRADGRRRDLGFGCLGHPSIMPTCAPTIKHPAHGVADESSARPDALPPTAPIRPGGVLAAQEPGETQNDHGDEHDSGNDCHPRRCLI